MRPYLHFAIAALAVLLCASEAESQAIYRPTPPPEVSAAEAGWFLRRAPIWFAGDLYYRAGPQVPFDGHVMVGTGSYDGVPLYADTTIEPYSIVFVPGPCGQMYPYERLRTGRLAGTTGSRPPSFPVQAVPGLPWPKTDDHGTGWDILGTDEDERLAQLRGGSGEVDAPASRSIIVLRRPTSNDGIWIWYEGRRWLSAGEAVPFDADRFIEVGRHHGFAVYRVRDGAGDVVYLPSREGWVAPYRAKGEGGEVRRSEK
jgi:hypothetical protein